MSAKTKLIALAGAVLAISSWTTAEAQDWKKEWARVLEEAKKEGLVIVYGPPGPFQREAIVTGWEKAFPDIKIEYTAARGSQARRARNISSAVSTCCTASTPGGTSSLDGPLTSSTRAPRRAAWAASA